MGKGGNRVGDKVCKLSNTNTATFINEVLEKYDYHNHDKEMVKENYVMVVDEKITGEFNHETKRLISNYGNKQYNDNIIKWLKENSPYYSIPDKKKRYHKISKENILLREYVFYLPEEEGERFRNDEALYKSWCDKNLEWFKNEFPTFYILAAVGHYKTEKTPHMQILFIPLDEKGKLNNNKYFYDKDEATGKNHKTGKIRQSVREQSYIKEVLQVFGIEGGIKGSTATHKNLDQYKSELKHELKELAQEKEEMQRESMLLKTEIEKMKTDEAYAENELLKKENSKLLRFIDGVDKILNEFFDILPKIVKEKFSNLINDFLNGNIQPER